MAVVVCETAALAPDTHTAKQQGQSWALKGAPSDQQSLQVRQERSRHGARLDWARTAGAREGALADAALLVATVQVALGLAVDAAVLVLELREAGWALARVQLDRVQGPACLSRVLQSPVAEFQPQHTMEVSAVMLVTFSRVSRTMPEPACMERHMHRPRSAQTRGAREEHTL